MNMNHLRVWKVIKSKQELLYTFGFRCIETWRYISLTNPKQAVKNDLGESRSQVVLFSVKTKRN